MVELFVIVFLSAHTDTPDKIKHARVEIRGTAQGESDFFRTQKACEEKLALTYGVLEGAQAGRANGHRLSYYIDRNDSYIKMSVSCAPIIIDQK